MGAPRTLGGCGGGSISPLSVGAPRTLGGCGGGSTSPLSVGAPRTLRGCGGGSTSPLSVGAPRTLRGCGGGSTSPLGVGAPRTLRGCGVVCESLYVLLVHLFGGVALVIIPIHLPPHQRFPEEWLRASLLLKTIVNMSIITFMVSMIFIHPVNAIVSSSSTNFAKND